MESFDNNLDFSRISLDSFDKFPIISSGREPKLISTLNSAPFAALRTEEFEGVEYGVEYEGTFFVDASTTDNDFVGVIWGFKVKLMLLS